MGMRASAGGGVLRGLALVGAGLALALTAQAVTAQTVTAQTGLAPQLAQTEVSAAPGMLTTRAFKDVPESETITVALYDDSDLNLQLKTEFEEQLKARERVVVEAKTGLLLLFETEVIPTDQVPKGPSLGSANAGTSGVDVNVNVWSSTQDSVLGGRQEGTNLGSSVFHMNALLRDQASGEVLWQGDAYYEMLTGDTERIARSMVPLLVDKLGQTTTHEPFDAP